MNTFLITCIWFGFVTGAATGFLLACVCLGSILAIRDAKDDSAD